MCLETKTFKDDRTPWLAGEILIWQAYLELDVGERLAGRPLEVRSGTPGTHRHVDASI